MNSRSSSRQVKVIKWITSSIYFFPLVVLVVLLLLTTFKINGSSIGIYHQSLYGNKVDDPDLLYGYPRPIRSDEWKVFSAFAALQSKTDYPAFNENLGSGRDVSIIPDAPTKDWLTLFRPQNLAFLALPFEYAFALRWWFGLALLMVSSYFFALRVLGGNKRLATILSLAFSISPFVLWWYQSALLIPLAYSLLIMTVGSKLVRQEPIIGIRSELLKILVYVLVLSFLGASFVLYLYAPFLIPLSIVIIAFTIGQLLDGFLSKRTAVIKNLAKAFGIFLVSILVIGAVVLLFAVKHWAMIQAIAESEYPGNRAIKSGGLSFSPLFPLLGSYLMPVLQSASRGVNYYANQSEVSNFILLMPLLIIPGIILQIHEFKKTKKMSYTFLTLQLVALVFILRISVSFGDPLYKLLLLDKVPHNRLLAGFGLVGFLQLLYFIKLYGNLKKFNRLKVTIAAFIYWLISLAALLSVGLYVKQNYPKFIDETLIIVLLAVFFSFILLALLLRKFLLASLLLLVFSLASSFRIMPLYAGTDFFKNSQIVRSIESVSAQSDRWVVLDDQTFQQLPAIAGRGNIGGYQIYTDLDFWRQIDRDGSKEHIYNRQGHALFLSNKLERDYKKLHNVYTIEADIELVKLNMFKVKFTCAEFTYNNIDYVLAISKLNLGCLELKDEVTYPKKTFYIYKIVRPS